MTLAPSSYEDKEDDACSGVHRESRSILSGGRLSPAGLIRPAEECATGSGGSQPIRLQVGSTVLPKDSEKGTVLTRNVLELVIQPADTEEALPGTRRFPVASTARGCDSKVSTAGWPAGPSSFKFRFIIIRNPEEVPVNVVNRPAGRIATVAVIYNRPSTQYPPYFL